MGIKEFSFNQEDITIVFDALQGFSPEELAQAWLEGGTASSDSQGLGRSRSTELAARRVECMLRVMGQLGPDCEASSRVIIPWKASHVAQLACVSWPEALGTRIAMPRHLPRDVRASLLANALASMSYV